MSDKNHEQKNKFTRRKIIIKNVLENRNFRPFLLLQRRRYICGLLPPARANGTKREAVWYSELYLFEKGVKNYFYGGDELRRI